MHKIRSYSHIAFHVKDMEAMKYFYCDQLGMKEKFTMTTDSNLEFAAWQESQGNPPSEHAKKYLDFAKANPGLPLITYIEMAERQFLELFYIYDELESAGSLAGKYGYQHLSIEVKSIKDTWDEVMKNGVVPDTEISQGPDYTYQFWVHDPEGNRIEFMEYTDLSLQVRGEVR